jgi:hypothetical protein
MTNKNMMIVLVVVGLLVAGWLYSSKYTQPTRTTATGKIESLSGQFTTWMYGSHVLKGYNGVPLYALTSDTVNLDAYVGYPQVMVEGTIVHEGFDGGPPLLNVTNVIGV